jgi:hypothetical protein
MTEIDINVVKPERVVDIIVEPNIITVNVTVSGGGGAVDSVNGQTGGVVLDADDIAETTSRYWLTNVLKTAYDSAVAWISTNGANILSHIASTSNPHNTTATQTDALKRDGSNANSDVDLGDFSLDAKSVKINGTGGAGHVGLKHQSSPATASGSETALYAGSDGELYYKNAGGVVAQVASRAWVNLQGFITNVITALGYTPENVANKATNLTSPDNTKYPTTLAVSEALAGKANTFLNVKISTTAYLTGTTVETEVYRLEIPANTFSAIDMLFLRGLIFQKIGTAAGYTIRTKLSTSPTMPSGTTDQIGTMIPTNTNISAFFGRGFAITAGNLIGLTATLNSSFETNQGNALLNVPFNPTITQYLYISITLGNANDQVRLVGGQISNV